MLSVLSKSVNNKSVFRFFTVFLPALGWRQRQPRDGFLHEVFFHSHDELFFFSQKSKLFPKWITKY
jgi:hypothetical protein